MRNLHRTLTLLLAVVLTIGIFARAHAADALPNIVLVMADDQGYGDMAYTGHPVLKTPNFDALAAEGLRLDRFYAAAPVCSPTRGSVMTGRTPNRYGVFKWGHPIRPQEITVAEALKKAGYTTGHFGKWHLGSCRKGSPVNPGASGFDRWLSAENFYDNNPILSDEGVATPIEGESSMIAADAAIEWIDRCVDEKKPFLAVVWFGSPHNPHIAAEQDKALYADQPKNKQNFYGEVTGMDRAVGKLRAKIKDLGIKENTLFWYTSDNGGLPGVGSTGGHRAHKGSVYEGGLRVPAIIEWPAKIPQPRTSEIRCITSDIYPTLIDIVGVKIDDQPPLDGVSLLPLIEGKMEKRPKPLGFWDFPIGGISTPSARWMKDLYDAQQAGSEPDDPGKLRLDAAEIKPRPETDAGRGHSAWIDGDWKLHRMGGKDGNAKYELYNLAEDKGETTNLIDEEPERAEKMKAALQKWQQSVFDSLNGADYK